AIGGRFSIFSPVGFFPMLLAGLKAQDFVNGAIEISNFFEKTPPEKNPIFILAHELIRHYPKRFIQVCMPYSTKLRLFGDWFVQMIGESLGKDGKGFTPIAALGATDQHSILQLLRDGPDDKITWFIVVDNIEDPVVIPNLTTSLQLTNLLPGFSILEGHSLHELLNIEYQATSLVLTRKQRPNLTIKLDQLDEKALGSLYFAVCVLTAFTGMLWDVSPFDQPGVEEGKIYIRNQLEGKN
ncbi:MAG: glucose-6-phosphate isomerase, partial [Deltaproteobacteria bacterium]|nr:glucose-6-phosphate isomerase [Deltaproteobacteria bacterium]